MEVILLLLTLFTSVIAKSIPTQNYVPTQDQLDLIFGGSPNQNETISVRLNDHADKSTNASNKSGLNTKLPEKKVSSEKDSVTVQITSRINTKPNDKQGASLNEKGQRNLNSTGDDPKDDKAKTKKGDVDDRVALASDYCPVGVRVGKICVAPA